MKKRMAAQKRKRAIWLMMAVVVLNFGEFISKWTFFCVCMKNFDLGKNSIFLLLFELLVF